MADQYQEFILVVSLHFLCYCIGLWRERAKESILANYNLAISSNSEYLLVSNAFL